MWLIAPILMAVLLLAKWSWRAVVWTGRLAWLACHAVAVLVVAGIHAMGRRRVSGGTIPPPPPAA